MCAFDRVLLREMQNFHFLCARPVAICASYLPDYWRILMRAKPGMCLFLSSNFFSHFRSVFQKLSWRPRGVTCLSFSLYLSILKKVIAFE